MANPIELLISLQANSDKSRRNINQTVDGLKKYYDRNPLLISLAVNKGRLERELSDLTRNLNNKKLQIDVGVTNSGGLKSLEQQIDKISSKIAMLNNQFSSIGSRNTGFGLSQSIASLNQLNQGARNATTGINGIQGATAQASRGLNDTAEGARNAARETGSLTNAFEQAFTKFPIWILAATAFYAPLRGAQDLIEKTVELDTALVSLQRVLDAPSYKFNELIETSLVNISDLSGKTTEYLEILNEFARQDNTPQQALDLANTAQIFTNISDLNAKESVDALTAATLAFNIAKEDSISIADKLNEVK